MACLPPKLSRYGHSSDHRSDRPQVLLAVATDPQGLPLHVEVLRGNRTGNKTLQGLLATLRRRFGIAKEPGEVPRILRRLQTLRIGRLKVGDKPVGMLMTDIPKELNDTLEKLGLLKLFATLPASVL